MVRFSWLSTRTSHPKGFFWKKMVVLRPHSHHIFYLIAGTRRDTLKKVSFVLHLLHFSFAYASCARHKKNSGKRSVYGGKQRKCSTTETLVCPFVSFGAATVYVGIPFFQRRQQTCCKWGLTHCCRFIKERSERFLVDAVTPGTFSLVEW